MPFMLVTLAVLTCFTVWWFFAMNPRGKAVNARNVLVCNLGAILVSLAGAVAAYCWIQAGAAALPEKQVVAWFLALSAAGAAFNALLAISGMIRNFVLYPLSRRDPGGDETAEPQEPR